MPDGGSLILNDQLGGNIAPSGGALAWKQFLVVEQMETSPASEMAEHGEQTAILQLCKLRIAATT